MSLLIPEYSSSLTHLWFMVKNFLGTAVVLSPSSQGKEDKGSSDDRRSQFFRVKISDAKTGDLKLER